MSKNQKPQSQYTPTTRKKSLILRIFIVVIAIVMLLSVVLLPAMHLFG